MSVNRYNSTTGELEKIAGGTLYADSPIGTISPFGGSAIPSGYLLCNGQAVSRTNYKELFAVIGVAFGSGDGSTTFNIPDLRGEFIRGAGTNSHTNQGNGGNVGEHQDSTEILAYYLNNTYSMQAFGKDENIIKKGDSWVKQATSHSAVFNGSSVSQGGGSYTVRPTNTSVNYIIKAKQVAVPFDIAEYIRNQNVLSEYENVTLPQNVEYTALYDGILIMGTPNAGELTINDIRTGYVTDGWGSGNFTVVVKKGDKVKYTGVSYLFAKIAYYKLRDYSGR